MRSRWQKIRFIAMLLCCVLLVNMGTGTITSHATGTTTRTQSNMHLNANGGEFTLLQNGVQSVTHMAWGQTFDVGTTLSSNDVVLDQISWGENQLLGWKRFEGIVDVSGNITPSDIGDDKLYTTEEVFNYTITADYDLVTFMAQWNMVESGDNTGSDDNTENIPTIPENYINIRFNGNGGTFKAVDKSATEIDDRTHSGWGTYIEKGSVVGDTVSMGDATFGENTLMCWIVGYEKSVDENNVEFVRLNDMTYQLADMMSYVVPADYAYDNLVFKAQWNMVGGNTDGNEGSDFSACKFVLAANGGSLLINSNDGMVTPPMITYNSGYDSLGDAMAASGHTGLNAERENHEFGGWKLYSFDKANTVGVPTGTVPEAEEGVTVKYLCTMYFPDEKVDMYVLMENCALVTESIPTQYLLTKETEKGLYAEAIWEENSGSEGSGDNSEGAPTIPENHINIIFSGNGGTFQAYDKNVSEPDDRTHNGWGTYIEKGTAVGETVSMSDATFGENTLMCWIVGYNNVIDEDTVEFVRLNENTYQLADIMAFVIPEEYPYDNIQFLAQWNMVGGDSGSGDSGYNGTKFVLNANGGYITMHRDNGTEVFDYKPNLLTYWSDEDTLADAMLRHNDTFKSIEREGYDFAGWKLYSFDSVEIVKVECGTEPEIGEDITARKVGYMRYQDSETGNWIEKDQYVLLKSATSGDSVPMEILFELAPEKGIYAEALWEAKPADVNKPVFEGLTVNYDADTNKIIFNVKAYDADSSKWGISIQFEDENGKGYWVYGHNISENPFTMEYDADKLLNGTYSVNYINIYDRSDNRFEQNFWNNEYTFEVTASPYECPVAVKDVIPSKDIVEVSKEKSEDVIVTVELSKGSDALVADPDNNNRVGYLCYWNSGYIDLYQDADGKLTGTYTVDWVNPSGKDYVYRIWLCTEVDAETGDAVYEMFEYAHREGPGVFTVENTTTWHGDMNVGPFRVKDVSVTDKSTGEALENGKFFDIADGTQYELDFSITLEEELPANARLELILLPGASNYSNRWVSLTKQADGKTYTGNISLNANMGCTEYSVGALGLGRGNITQWYYLNYNVQPYFNITNNGNYVKDTKELTVKMYSYAGKNPEVLLEKKISLEGHPSLTVEDIVGNAEEYAALVEKTKREDGSVCDGWVDSLYATDSSNYYDNDDVINLYANQTYLTLWTTYAESEVQVNFQYMLENGGWWTHIGSPVKVEKGTSLNEILDMLKADGKIPEAADCGEYKFVGWDTSDFMDGELEFSHKWYVTLAAEYTVPRYRIAVAQYIKNAEGNKYQWVNYVKLYEEDATVKDVIDGLGTPYVPEGDTFLRWDYADNCWVDGKEIPWQEDMLLTEYGCPAFQAIYQSMLDTDDDDDDDDDDEEVVATPTPTPTPAPTAAPTVAPIAQPVVTPNITPVEPTATKAPAATSAPAIVTPPGVELSEKKVAEKVEQIEKALEALKAPASTETTGTTGEKKTPVIVLDMKTEDNKPATMVPVEVLEVIKGQDVDVVLDMGDYSWTVNGADVKATELASINLEVKVDADAIPSKLVDTLAGGAPATQLSLTHNGDFGFKASLTVNMGAENAGQFGNMYYYDSDNRLVFMNAGKIDEDGNVELSFSHASDYVVIVGEEVVADEGTVAVESDGKLVASAKEEETAKPEQSEKADVTVIMDDSEQAADNGAVLVIIVLLVIAVAAIGIVFFLQKRKNN